MPLQPELLCVNANSGPRVQRTDLPSGERFFGLCDNCKHYRKMYDEFKDGKMRNTLTECEERAARVARGRCSRRKID
jgi:hypothetical protein